MKALSSTEYDCSRHGNIYALAKEKFKLLRNFKINHVYREGNQVAHCLAQFARNCSTE